MVSPSDSTTTRQQQAQRAADRAERDAAQRIQSAEKQVRDAQLAAEAKIDEIKDQYVKRSETERDRREEALLGIQEKNSQELRKLKAQQSRDLSKSRDQGERDLRTLQDHYRDTLTSTMREGETELRARQLSAQQEKEALERNSALEIQASRQDHASRFEGLKQQQEADFAREHRVAKEQYEKLKSDTTLAQDTARQKFETRYQTVLEDQNDALTRTNTSAARKVEDIRRDTAAKLTAYSDRQSDPFYQILDLEAQLREDSDAFILSAKIPEHERDNVSVTIQGGRNLVVSGHRRAEETLEDEPGHRRSTASYQRFSESFPLNHPVDARSMVREFDGDWLIVHLPKKPFYEPAPQFRASAPERVRAERPQFPKNLNVAENTKAPDAERPEPSEKSSSSRTRPGNRTLG